MILAIGCFAGCSSGEDYPHVTYKAVQLPDAEIVIALPEFTWNGETDPQPITIPVPTSPTLKPGMVLKLRGTIHSAETKVKPGGILAKIIRPKTTTGEDVQSVAVKEVVVQNSVWNYEFDIRAPLKPGSYVLQLSQIWSTPDPIVFATGQISIAK